MDRWGNEGFDAKPGRGLGRNGGWVNRAKPRGSEGGFVLTLLCLLIVMALTLTVVGVRSFSARQTGAAVDPKVVQSATASALEFIEGAIAQLRHPKGLGLAEDRGVRIYPRARILALCGEVRQRIKADLAGGAVVAEVARVEEVFSTQCGGMVALANSKEGLSEGEASLRADRIERIGGPALKRAKLAHLAHVANLTKLAK